MATLDFKEIKELKIFRKTMDLEVDLREEELKGAIATTAIKTEIYQETQQDMHDEAVDHALERAGATEEQRHAYWRKHPAKVLDGIDLDEVFGTKTPGSKK